MISWRAAFPALIALAAAVAQGRAEEPIGILLAAGDIAKCGRPMHEKTAALVAQQVKQADAKKIPVHVLVLGDLAYEHGKKEEFDCFDASWGSLLRLELKNSDVARLMLPVPGNHDYEPAGPARPYYDYFEKNNSPWVFQQEPGEKKQQANNKGYYTLKFPDPKIGPWQLFALNSELRDKATTKMMEKQNDWLDQKLKATDPQLTPSRPPCVLAFWHRPLFSSGSHGHGDCYDIEGTPCQKKGAPLCRPDQEAQPYCGSLMKMKKTYQVLYDQGASVILTGHDHNYEQFKRLDPNAKPDQSRGIRSFVVGTGGAGLYRESRTHRWSENESEFYKNTSHGVLRIELFADRYRWSFLHVEQDGNPPISLVKNGVALDNDRCIARP